MKVHFFFIALTVYARNLGPKKLWNTASSIKLNPAIIHWAFLHDPGAYNHCIDAQVFQYILFKADCEYIDLLI